MPLPIDNVLGILSDNLEKRKGALPLSKSKATSWAKGLNIPSGGETVLYTGQMYQLIPSINAMVGQMSMFENSWITSYFGLGRTVNKVVNLSMFMGFGTSGEQKEYNGYLRNIAQLLKKAGVDFGYLYGQDLYTGALLYDEGVDDVFEGQVRRVYEILKRNGTRRVITVDPHTTNMLRSVYPEVVSGFDFEVKSYIEVLAELGIGSMTSLDIDLVVHDSCIYARHESMTEEPRILLENAGATLHESVYSRKFTHCCGGSLEVLFPSKSHVVAVNRVEQLAACSDRITTMCPVCLAGLRRAAGPEIKINDISDYLVQAYCGQGIEESPKEEPVLV